MVVVILVALASLTAAGNIAGAVGAVRRKRRGERRGFSTVPAISLLLATAAWIIGPEPVGLWVFLPAALDPGTWTVLLLPWYALTDPE